MLGQARAHGRGGLAHVLADDDIQRPLALGMAQLQARGDGRVDVGEGLGADGGPAAAAVGQLPRGGGDVLAVDPAHVLHPDRLRLAVLDLDAVAVVLVERVDDLVDDINEDDLKAGAGEELADETSGRCSRRRSGRRFACVCTLWSPALPYERLPAASVS